jgi:hypothetical protein
LVLDAYFGRADSPFGINCRAIQNEGRSRRACASGSHRRSSTLAASVCFRTAFLVAPAAEHGLDALRQEPLRERLSDEIVSAHLEAKYFVKFIVFGA